MGTNEQAADQSAPADSAGAEALGDPGKKALDAMKQKWHEARDEAAALREQVAGFDAQLAAARTEAESKARSVLAAQSVQYAVKAAAAGKLSRPELATKLIDLSTIEVNEQGTVDESAVATAVNKLVEEFPELAARRFIPDPDKGQRGATPPPAPPTMNDILRAARG